MGMKPRVKPVVVADETEADGLIPVDPILSETGKHKTVGIITSLHGSEAVEVKIHRRPEGHDITRMNIERVNFKRKGRGMAAMKPGCEKELVITVRYVDGS